MSLRSKMLAIAALLCAGWMSSPASAQSFLQFPLRCSDTACTIDYRTRGAYTANAITSVLDHRMKLNSTNYYPYGKYSSNGGDKRITAFNGESVSGPTNSDETCVGGTIYLRPDWDRSRRMTNDRGCGIGYTSYDEHPGYDYRAMAGAPVYAAASGHVISTICYLGNAGTGTCASWGALAINHGNGYFSQYLHMNTTIPVSAGQFIAAGQQIGTVGGRCGSGCSLPAHLHFEVRRIGPRIGAEAYPTLRCGASQHAGRGPALEPLPSGVPVH
jgi:murein DD-endopeptidase MepM/ murein hydrolase activator NlpD